jgi:hypothetical protein
MINLLKSNIEMTTKAISNEIDNNLTSVTLMDVSKYQKGLISGLSELKEAIKKLVDKSNPVFSDASQSLTLMGQIHSTAILLESVLLAHQSSSSKKSTIFGPIKQVLSWVQSTLIPWLRNLWGAVWAIIKSKITPKEWKIKGSIGTGVLGFANAEIEITFR